MQGGWRRWVCLHVREMGEAGFSQIALGSYWGREGRALLTLEPLLPPQSLPWHSSSSESHHCGFIRSSSGRGCREQQNLPRPRFTAAWLKFTRTLLWTLPTTHLSRHQQDPRAWHAHQPDPTTLMGSQPGPLANAT